MHPHYRSNAQDDSLAQQVEHIPFKDGVLGSNPRRITKGSQFATLFLFTYLLNTAQFKKALLEWRNILHFAPKDNVNVGRLPPAGVHAYASGGAHAVGCRI